ncbi:hypothetical protein OHU17_25050 [Streptomyces goshikiensis]|uniref:Uncharacterized protein n=1 Tax=Streptomyces goshikiensis TaxID=1942 RepID=A0ABZ1RSD3_9ACTN|nr:MULTISPECIES: hypothetical protein [Streptomyces]MBP0934064.1 hypothetical protein [Streptomyces sp. KCTC 0041BP]OKI41120.1 hypothetical protein A6A28_27955 [Streptomyces sp. CB03578]
MNTTSTAPGPAAGTRPWVLVPALFTALALTAGGFGYASSALPGAPLWLLLPYLLALGLVAATWRRPRTPDQRAARIATGAAGCALALFYARIAEALLFCAGIVAWLVQGD